MKKDKDKDKTEMVPEYDFSGLTGVRGKYAKAFRKGHTVRIFDGEKLVSDRFFVAIEPECSCSKQTITASIDSKPASDTQ